MPVVEPTSPPTRNPKECFLRDKVDEIDVVIIRVPQGLSKEAALCVK